MRTSSCTTRVSGLITFPVDSSDFGRDYLRALESCAIEGGFIRNRNGDVTVHKARAQTALFNATSSWFANPNRRSHDKLIVKDGIFGEKAYALTGGRNVSLDYFGFDEEGAWNTHTYLPPLPPHFRRISVLQSHPPAVGRGTAVRRVRDWDRYRSCH